jgi:hypothetical protein
MLEPPRGCLSCIVHALSFVAVCYMRFVLLFLFIRLCCLCALCIVCRRPAVRPLVSVCLLSYFLRLSMATVSWLIVVVSLPIPPARARVDWYCAVFVTASRCLVVSRTGRLLFVSPVVIDVFIFCVCLCWFLFACLFGGGCVLSLLLPDCSYRV